MSSPFAESVLEDAVLDWFGALGYEVAHGPHIAPGEPAAERNDFRETILRGRLLSALRRLNPDLASTVLQEAERRILTADSPVMLSENRRLHRVLVMASPSRCRMTLAACAACRSVSLIRRTTPTTPGWR